MLSIPLSWLQCRVEKNPDRVNELERFAGKGMCIAGALGDMVALAVE